MPDLRMLGAILIDLRPDICECCERIAVYRADLAARGRASLVNHEGKVLVGGTGRAWHASHWVDEVVEVAV